MISSKSAKLLLKLVDKNEPVSTAKSAESFHYLLRYLDFDMSIQMHKTELSNMASSILNAIDSLPLYTKINLDLLSKIPWHFNVCNLPETWMCQNLENAASHYIQKWLDLPIFSTLRISFFLMNNLALILFFHEPNSLSVALFTVMR